MLKVKAFTLSEAMITIGVIGVIAALVIPALKNSAPDKNKIMFKKAHAVLEQTVQSLTNNSEEFIDGNLSQPKNNHNMCYYFAQTVNTVGDVHCDKSATGGAVETAPGVPSFITADGTWWYFTNGVTPDNDEGELASDDGSNASNVHILVDVDGGNNGKNCGTCIVQTYNTNACQCAANTIPDRFMFGVRSDGKIFVFGTVANQLLQNPTKNCKKLNLATGKCS